MAILPSGPAVPPMRRAIRIFLAAILLPSLVLAWLAVRSARDQQVILEHQQAIISQDLTDALAGKVRERLEELRPAFIGVTQELLRKSSGPRALAGDFDRALRSAWDLADVGFAVSLDGTIYSPKPGSPPAAQTFRRENDRFLSNRESVPVFSPGAPTPAPVPIAGGASYPPLSQGPAIQSQFGQQQSLSHSQSQSQAAPVPRQVAPQQNFAPQKSVLSNSLPADSDFSRIVGKESSGSLARFSEDHLRLMVWYRPRPAGPLVFGAQISRPSLIRSLDPLLRSAAGNRDDGAAYCLALLDDRGKPAALSRTGFTADWKHPLVATEIGEGLPHWEAALYLVDPQEIGRSASTLQFTLGATVVSLVATILLGGWFMSANVRSQMRLAQQKTDFVSNVSHELKTPLTSIRMFADMLAEGRIDDPERRNHYLRIVSAESARLTRLIEGVLSFARMEKGIAAPERRDCDLVEIAREAVGVCLPQAESAGVTIATEMLVDALPLAGDRDSLAQIVFNLLSNAEKYGGGEILLRVRRETRTGYGIVEVLDRGPGIPHGMAEAIFRPFYRLDDSLASGVSGSGLGLTLARRMAREHGGEVSYAPREGGGSCFTLAVPLGPPR